MKLLLVIILVGIVFFSGCVRRDVAMNMYQPGSDNEKVSGVTMVLTKSMIERAKRR